MNVPLLLAGTLALAGALIHGIGGELLVVRKLTTAGLPASPFGGPGATMRMIRGTWHMTTIAFATFGAALISAGSALEGDAARAVALFAATASTGFALVAIVGALARSPRSFWSLFRHPAPPLLSAVAALAWWGVA